MRNRRLINELLIFRAVEDYAVVFFGSALFKMLRLFVVTAFSVHFFACIFYHVKVPILILCLAI